MNPPLARPVRTDWNRRRAGAFVLVEFQEGRILDTDNTTLVSARFVLREATHDAHMTLEQEIGGLTDRTGYVRYLRGLGAFRASLEPVLASWASRLPGFQMTRLAHLLARDLEDLGCSAIEAPEATRIETMADALGSLYVLEGSALGARVLIKRMEALGLGPNHGARHLSHQAGSLMAWRRLVELLDTPSFNATRAAAAANATFKLAHDCMKRAGHG